MKLDAAMAAAYLGVSLRTVQRWVADGDLPPGLIDSADAKRVKREKAARRDRNLAQMRHRMSQ